MDDPDHYDYLEFNTAPPPTTSAVERSPDNYQRLDRGRAPPPPAPHHYAGIAASASRPPTSSDAHDYLQPMEPVRNDERRSGLELPWQPSGSRDRGAAGLIGTGGGNGQGEATERGDYQRLDPAELEESRRRAAKPHVYAELKVNVEDLQSRPVKR